MGNILFTPDMCMRFLVWSYYYHGVMPQKNVSFAACGLFASNDVPRLDELKTAMFECFEEESVLRACLQMQHAKVRNEPSPFPQSELNKMFAAEL